MQDLERDFLSGEQHAAMAMGLQLQRGIISDHEPFIKGTVSERMSSFESQQLRHIPKPPGKPQSFLFTAQESI